MRDHHRPPEVTRLHQRIWKTRRMFHSFDTGWRAEYRGHIYIAEFVKENVVPSGFKVYAANGTHIATFGFRTLTLDLGLWRPYTSKLIVTKVQLTIGADFLQHHGLLIDRRNKRIIGTTTPKYRDSDRCTTQPTVTTVGNENGEKYTSLLKRYIDVTRPTQRHNKPKHKVRHHIITKSRPCAKRTRRLAPEKYRAAREEFQLLIQQRICQQSSSE
ncbi:unnamed protein product [Heterotrigona itama]|uniref:Uncharacterized protein n=1 Tax=Heterotrigona itama TaxID=395501 RepID=A0A6V7HHC6_9HYME|nr:unnamed protein product [Heterotrigona itama]